MASDYEVKVDGGEVVRTGQANPGQIVPLADNETITPEYLRGPAVKGPIPKTITVGVRRVIQTKPYESAEIKMEATCEVDTNMKLGENLDKVAKLLVAKVDWHIAVWNKGIANGN